MTVGLTLCVYQFIIHNFYCTITDVVHFPHPQHLIVCFELFGYAFTLCKLFYEPIKHFCRFFVDICEVSGKFTTCKKVRISYRVLLLNIAQMPLTPNSDFNFWLFR